jgi:hypothetical protein
LHAGLPIHDRIGALLPLLKKQRLPRYCGRPDRDPDTDAGKGIVGILPRLFNAALIGVPARKN